MEPLTRNDLTLINDLSGRTYTNFTLSSNTTQNERDRFNRVKNKLLRIAEFFASRYDAIYGPFTTSVSPEANPLNRQSKFHNVWSTFFKGATNKQYAAQISFVIDRETPCLNVGFYFGRASAIKLEQTLKLALETNLINLGVTLSDTITNNEVFQTNYNSLFDFGFTAYSNGQSVLPDEWCDLIRTNASNSQITARIFPNEFGIIENTTLDSFVSQVIFIMGTIRNANQPQAPIFIAPLTPGQRAKEAERLAEIGHKGELFIMEEERRKLTDLGIAMNGYPRHVALESTHFGYDVLSLDTNQNEIFIEVKSTTRSKNDERAKFFYISNNEVNKYEANRDEYFIYRVYSVENNPSFDKLILDDLVKTPDGYIVTYE